MNDIAWTPPVGHNLPPLDLAALLTQETIAALVDERFREHRDRAAKLLEADQRFAEATKDGIRDDATAERATDFVRQLKAAVSAVEDTHTEVKKPVLAAGRQIDAAKNGLIDPLNTATGAATKKLKAHLAWKAEETRKAAEAEAKRKAEEAAALVAKSEAIAADPNASDEQDVAATQAAVRALDEAQEAHRVTQASAADLSRTRTTLGGVASLRQNWTFEIADKMALLRAIVAGEASADYVLPNDSLLKALAKSQKDNAKVAGVRFFNDAGVTIR